MITTATCIVLSTLNARYIHASLGLRYLLANMDRHGEPGLRRQTSLCEFTLQRPTDEMVSVLLSELGEYEEGKVQILGLGIYIWNVEQSTRLVQALKAARPSLIVVLGGPEVSHEWEMQAIVALADYLITGWGDVSFPRLCRDLAVGHPPAEKLICGVQRPLNEIELPYRELTDRDIAERLVYVEASRGCPFKCEFCLSSLDKTAWAFETRRFLAEMDILLQRGVRHFKFVDRTFNLKLENTAQILRFFLERMRPGLFLHFELVPDHLPEPLKQLLQSFPAGVIQLEVGIQTFNPAVQQTISRRQDNARSEANLRWLLLATQVHLHADLIFGLPGESLASFAEGFDRLYAIGPHEIQLGILKRLRGTPIVRHTVDHGLRFNVDPPYLIEASADLEEKTVVQFSRLARYWDLLANSGRFPRGLKRLLAGPSAFAALWDFSLYLWQKAGKTHGLSPEFLLDTLFDYLSARGEADVEPLRNDLLQDYLASGARANPSCLQGLLTRRDAPVGRESRLAERQSRHVNTALSL